MDGVDPADVAKETRFRLEVGLAFVMDNGVVAGGE
jgi:hypothetical protein